MFAFLRLFMLFPFYLYESVLVTYARHIEFRPPFYGVVFPYRVGGNNITYPDVMNFIYYRENMKVPCSVALH